MVGRDRLRTSQDYQGRIHQQEGKEKEGKGREKEGKEKEGKERKGQVIMMSAGPRMDLAWTSPNSSCA